MTQEEYYKHLEEKGTFPDPHSCDNFEWCNEIWERYKGRIEPNPDVNGTYRIKK